MRKNGGVNIVRKWSQHSEEERGSQHSEEERGSQHSEEERGSQHSEEEQKLFLLFLI